MNEQTQTARSYADLAKKLHDKGVELDAQLRNLSRTNADLVVKCQNCLAALKEFTGSNALAAKISCSVCCTRERTHCLIPCGHGGLCEACAERAVRRGRCFTCRGDVEQLLKVFL